LDIHDKVACAKLLYSFSVLEQAIACCFQDQRDIKLGQRKIASPGVDLPSSTSEVLLLSNKALKETELCSNAGSDCKP